jgi:hypothetical protein
MNYVLNSARCRAKILKNNLSSNLKRVRIKSRAATDILESRKAAKAFIKTKVGNVVALRRFKTTRTANSNPRR